MTEEAGLKVRALRYTTARKQALGLGASGSGTGHFWRLTKSSVALVVLVPLFVWMVGPVIGRPHLEVVAHFSRPFPAIVTALTLVVGWLHFRDGVQVPIQDYWDGLTRKGLLMAMSGIAYAAAAAGIFALARMAL